MTTDTDPRVEQAMMLVHSLGFASTAADVLDAERELREYLAEQFDHLEALQQEIIGLRERVAKVPSAPVEAVPLSLLEEIDLLCQQSLKVPFGVATKIPDRIRVEMEKFMRDEPSEIDRLPFGLVRSLSERPAVQQLATIPPQSGKTENEIDRLETEVARVTAELQEVRKDAALSLTPAEVERIADEHRNAAGGIYSTRVYEFACNVLAAAMTKEKPNGSL